MARKARAKAKGGRKGAEDETENEADENEQQGAIAMILPKESVIKSLAKTARSTKERAGEIAGIFGSEAKEAYEKKHVDRKALSLALSLDRMDPERLQITLPHLLHYIEVLGIDKRASLQGELLPTDANGRVTGAGPGDDGKGNVTQLRTPRQAAEAAGDTTH